MALGVRKLIVLGLIGGVFLLANTMFLAYWLQEMGVVDLAQRLREEFITGTAITVVVVLLILLVNPRSDGSAWIRRCPVCEHRILRGKERCALLPEQPAEVMGALSHAGHGEVDVNRRPSEGADRIVVGRWLGPSGHRFHEASLLFPARRVRLAL